mmetsp:Transcript_89959/g.188082  ORF Transcript_89959/g.188082 Transcript_89959/m.188082 type:complete len:874 (+) Transcript_89959:180-2801(+)|eukprot:CAMPEP_0206454480 /NCGR_PEP_ID=MMETSP0324_2-20121206/21159_1 /ASSEMBLY_ACC=CAM_ASM_000836 /TAXON_ID=2866 /ORGANISM="Crypthecodinium cohnii, Strain Seligo" /LENGTH=873 /DNA_ID=CAMNT_0053924955 /DNA_START=167 /DNA_END=2788 /DNA_ORIENTATION=-
MSKMLGSISRVFGPALAPIPAKEKYKVAIIGGGAAGCSVASQLLRKLGFPKGDVAIIEPKDEHLYMPKWTMVGGLGLSVESTARPMGKVIPDGVDWIKERCQTFDPENNSITLGNGQKISYDVLVVAAGLQQNFGKIRGLAETIGQNGVASIYSYTYSPIVWDNIQNTKQGRAIFTNPATPVNCGGAPQKIMYLAEHAWRNNNVRNKIDIEYCTPTPGVFTCPYYSVELEKLMISKGITPKKKTNLVEVDGSNKLAMFEREDGEIFTEEFDFLHVTPPMSAPSFLANSGLTNAAGYVDVDKETCQHTKYDNVFALGDCSALPTSKTYSAIASQAPVVVHNITNKLQPKPGSKQAAYSGYTACPVLVGDSKLMLAEFNGYTMEPAMTFKPLDQRIPTVPFYLMKRFIFEEVYWHFMPIGRWFGSRTIFPPSLQFKEAGVEEKPANAVLPSARLALQADLDLPSKSESEDASKSEGAIKPIRFGVETPAVPGNMSLSGSLPIEAVKALAPRYKGWLYLNPADHPDFHKKEIEEAGCKLENVHLPGGYSGGVPEPHHAQDLLAAMRRLPRPLMIQCTSGNRSGAALMLWLAKESGRSVEAATLLAQDMDLKFYHCSVCGPVWEWLQKEIGETPASFKEPEETGYVLEQLFDSQGSSTFTYLLGCNATKEALLIDPVLGMEDRDLMKVAERGMTLKYVVNTHAHADHITSGSVIKRKEPQVKTIISKASGAKGDILLADNDVIKFGDYSLKALATPGHTDGCMSFVLEGPNEPRAVFTGDTLLIRGCGRTDFQQGNAALLYDNIWNKIFSLPDDTKVYPGHDYKGRNISSVKEERQFNPRLTKGKDEFIKIMNGLNLPYPKLVDIAVPANLKCGDQD